ncbi:hypothetical protein [Liquorilactobacillus vini]|uniref:Phosphoglucomutase n=1 Tax=Liquorilactobacillus vini DSM 20605 TaxID=1133569 RepID=A0A0R2BXE4_9LACO|nr:hypothetical protein [Liquorilactobacillus vini]KRM83298.1 phosphoglucomutase [Liquorilactobacillus vini DSM 20605]
MNWESNYQRWLKKVDDPVLRKKILSLDSEKQKKDHFEGYASFGTGGIRAKMDIGTKYFNKYTVGRATVGLGNYLIKANVVYKEKGVVISYDTRANSKNFAWETASILSRMGIKVYLSDFYRPTPELSFLVRDFHAAAGVMITASHNPYQYNGYKVYNKLGCQITLSAAKKIIKEISHLNYS